VTNVGNRNGPSKPGMQKQQLQLNMLRQLNMLKETQHAQATQIAQATQHAQAYRCTQDFIFKILAFLLKRDFLISISIRCTKAEKGDCSFTEQTRIPHSEYFH